jgi:hypothetical protein
VEVSIQIRLGRNSAVTAVLANGTCLQLVTVESDLDGLHDADLRMTVPPEAHVTNTHSGTAGFLLDPWELSGEGEVIAHLWTGEYRTAVTWLLELWREAVRRTAACGEGARSHGRGLAASHHAALKGPVGDEVEASKGRGRRQL